MTSYSSGDAKWVFRDVPVTPNTLYTFSDAYRSNVTTQLVAQYTATNGSVSYAWIADVPAAASWATTNYQLSTPANAESGRCLM